jgi:hypothetical protein
MGPNRRAQDRERAAAEAAAKAKRAEAERKAVVFSNVLTGCLPLRVTLRSAPCIVYVRRRAPPDRFAIVAPQAAILQGTL